MFSMISRPRRWLVRFTLIFLLGLVAAYFATIVQAQSGTVTDDDVNRVAREMYCPTCENTPLDVCPTQTCQDWRDLIKEQLEAGWTKEAILSYFGETYGDRVLAEPPRRGFDLVVWSLPVLGLIAGGILLYRYLVSIRTSAVVADQVAKQTPAPAADDYVARIEQELGER